MRDLLRARVSSTAAIAGEVAALDPVDLINARVKQQAVIAVRRGQDAFRRMVLAAYGGVCAITGSDVEPSLEAAHIVPYRGASTNVVTNGLLLRSDIHTLFDGGYLGINPDDGFKVRVSRALQGTQAAPLAGQSLALPTALTERPDPALLRWHLRSVMKA